MEEVRRYHNLTKRQLIQRATQKGMTVLDVGCGFGGDLQKWDHVKPKVLDMCDPLRESLREAKERAKNLGISANFFEGDISNCPKKKYQVICYNFSLHYIFETKRLFMDSLQNIVNRLDHGGKLIGVIPDSEAVLMNTPFRDNLGNAMTRGENTGYGDFGEKLFVMLADTPFYNGLFRKEPIAYKDLLITQLGKMGLRLEEWKPLEGHSISEMYSQFIFVCE